MPSHCPPDAKCQLQRHLQFCVGCPHSRDAVSHAPQPAHPRRCQPHKYRRGVAHQRPEAPFCRQDSGGRGEGGGAVVRPPMSAHSSAAIPPPPLCAIPSGCCSFTGPWTVTRSSLRMLRRVAAFCRPLRPVLPLVSFPRSRSPVVGVPGLCGMRRDVPFARQRRPIVGVPGVVLVVAGVV